MIVLFVLASELRQNALVLFGGQFYVVDFPHTSVTGTTTLELLPLIGRRRAVHIQMHRDTPMAVHIPLM